MKYMIHVPGPRTHSNGIDIAGVALECLFALAIPDVPQFGQRVTGPRNEHLHIRGQSQAHTITHMVKIDNLLLARLYIPQCTRREQGLRSGWRD